MGSWNRKPDEPQIYLCDTCNRVTVHKVDGNADRSDGSELQQLQALAFKHRIMYHYCREKKCDTIYDEHGAPGCGTRIQTIEIEGYFFRKLIKDADDAKAEVVTLRKELEEAKEAIDRLEKCRKEVEQALARYNP